jgi:hypothetical protein
VIDDAGGDLLRLVTKGTQRLLGLNRATYE